MADLAPADQLASPDADGLVGGITIWYSESLPSPKYRFCDGSELSRSEFSLLFGRLGTAGGSGDGSSTFNLPDLRGKFLVGLTLFDTDFDDLADTGGAKEVQLASDEMPDHTHPVSGTTSGPSSTAGVDSTQSTLSVSYNETHTFNVTSGYSSGHVGANYHPNLPPYKVVHYIIKVL